MHRFQFAVVVIVLICVRYSLAWPPLQDEQIPSRSEVTFIGAGGLELKGTLELPAKAKESSAKSAVAAVLLLPGSGPTDRDGNQQPYFVTNLLAQISERLVAQNIATLRFDKRACKPYVQQWPNDPPEMSEFFSYENFVADATAAFQFLARQEGIDPARVAILGHSEGGLFALQIASDLAEQTPRPAGLILAGTAGRTLDILVREQMEFLLDGQINDQSVKATMLEHVDRGIEEIKQHKRLPADVPPGLRSLFNPSAVNLLYAYFTVNPRELAAKVRGPVLVVQGQNDSQILADRDAPALHSALKRRDEQPSELLIVPEASHNLKAAATKRDAGFNGPVVPAALDAVVQWCDQHLAIKGK